MITFNDSRDKPDDVPIPAHLFSDLLTEVGDLAELQCALRLLFLLHRQRDFPRFISLRAMKADIILLRALGRANAQENLQNTLERAVQGCVKAGLFILLEAYVGNRNEPVLLLNTPENQRAVVGVRRGEISLPSSPDLQPIEEVPPLKDIFILYEENVGIITPLIADELSDAEAIFPLDWIQGAILEAVTNNKRNWKYIAAILRRWAQEGKTSGAPWRNLEAVPATKLPRRPQGPLLK